MSDLELHGLDGTPRKIPAALLDRAEVVTATVLRLPLTKSDVAVRESPEKARLLLAKARA